MAYVLKMNKHKTGEVTFFINSVNRIPGTKNGRKEVNVEKYSYSKLVSEGKQDPEAFVRSRLEELRKDRTHQVKTTCNFKVDFSLPIDFSCDKHTGVSNDSTNLGYSAYSKLYHLLELDYLINARRQHVKSEYNINVLFQHLVYSRLLWPDSKLGTWEGRQHFYGDTDYGLQSVYRCMDNILSWREDILTCMDRQMKEKFGRKGTVIFYDVTNYYFELDTEDDEDGLRAKGVSKEHRPEPIVQMGLFMDENGLPITYELFRGNTNDSVTLHEAMDRCIIDFSESRRIVVADKGMMSYYNILKIREARNGYVISQSIRKSDQETQDFALSTEGWEEITNQDGEVVQKIKERIIPRKASSYGDVDAKKHSGTYNERQVFLWSKKYEERAKFDRQKAIEEAKRAVGSRSKDFKDSSYGKNKYLTKKAVKDGKAIDHDGCVYEFNEQQLKEDERFDGYYIICTNVIGVEDKKDIRKDKPENWSYYRDSDGFLVMNHVVTASEIAKIYGGLWRIEETFKVTKTSMINLRPVFHSLQDRIRAHFLICFVALVLERLLEYKLNWKYSAKSIQESLSSFNAVNLTGSNIYQISYYDGLISEVMKTLEIDISKKFITREELRKIFGSTKKV